MSIPRMRTLRECEAYFKAQDPDTKVTYWRLRRWVMSGKIPCKYSGNTKLINLDVLIDILNDTTPEDVPERKQDAHIISLENRRKVSNG